MLPNFFSILLSILKFDLILNIKATCAHDLGILRNKAYFLYSSITI